MVMDWRTKISIKEEERIFTWSSKEKTLKGDRFLAKLTIKFTMSWKKLSIFSFSCCAADDDFWISRYRGASTCFCDSMSKQKLNKKS